MICVKLISKKCYFHGIPLVSSSKFVLDFYIGSDVRTLNATTVKI